MRKLGWALAVALLWANATFGQGTVLFTWHGNSNFFQASFEVTATEMQPGGHFTSQLFLDSISVDSLSGVQYTYNNTGIANGDANPFALSIDLFDFGRGTEIHLGAGDDLHGLIDEQPFGGPTSYAELGYWTYTVIPEPSTGAFITLSVAVLGWRRFRVRSTGTRRLKTVSP